MFPRQSFNNIPNCTLPYFEYFAQLILRETVAMFFSDLQNKIFCEFRASSFRSFQNFSKSIFYCMDLIFTFCQVFKVINLIIKSQTILMVNFLSLWASSFKVRYDKMMHFKLFYTTIFTKKIRKVSLFISNWPKNRYSASVKTFKSPDVRYLIFTFVPCNVFPNFFFHKLNISERLG